MQRSVQSVHSQMPFSVHHQARHLSAAAIRIQELGTLFLREERTEAGSWQPEATCTAWQIRKQSKEL